jgi:bifunctional non-homologous end joining protein LigD
MRDLQSYRQKRDPARTPEPFGDEGAAPRPQAGGPGRFVVQQHAARRLHFDLRLEIEGVLVSWAVPRGPTYDAKEKRLAVRTEDHPLEYAHFEGVIPKGNYGAGAMIVWDLGTYRSVDANTPEDGLAAGKLDLELHGMKLRGRFALVRTKRGAGNEWLLLRKGAPPAPGLEPVRDQPASVLSGLTVEEIREAATRDAAVAAALEAVRAPRRALDREALRPMLASAGGEPFSRAGWLFELKYDGVRTLAVKEPDGTVRLVARAGGERSRIYPEIARAVARVPLGSFVLDGEIVALDERGRSSFERIQRRFTQSDPAEIARVEREVPVVYHAFDLLAAQGRDLRALPLEARKEILASFVPSLGVVRYTDHVASDGKRLFEAARDHGLEGVIAKRADAKYESGRRSAAWLKWKVPRVAPFAIAGWTAGKGTRARLGALLLAGAREGGLVYAGSAGSGLDERTIAALLPQLEAARVAEPPCTGVPVPPPAGARWTRPALVCDVRFSEVTSAGLLRQPVFLKLRPDLGVAETRASGATAVEPDPREAEKAKGAAPEPELALSRLDKVFWPLEGYTKGDLLAYYEAVWPWLAPYLHERPVVLTRYPDGIAGKSFYQKNAPDFTPGWVARQRIDDTDYFLCNDLRSLLYVINSGAIPLHVWSARRGALERPDWLILDLDPKGAPFEDVVLVARCIHALLGDLGAPHFAKTSGQDGLHVLLPLGGALDHEQTRSFAEVLARAVCGELPELATIARPLAARGGKVYVDFLQNGRGKLIASPLSVRPRPGAPVSMPLAWKHVTKKLDPARFTIRTALARLERDGDPLADVLGKPVDVARVLGALAARLDGAKGRRGRGKR